MAEKSYIDKFTLLVKSELHIGMGNLQDNCWINQLLVILYRSKVSKRRQRVTLVRWK